MLFLQEENAVRTTGSIMNQKVLKMNIGYCINKEITRVSRELLSQFDTIPIPNLDDAMNRTAAATSTIRPLNGARLMGTAYTVRVPAGDNLLFYYAIDNAHPGDVIVVDGGGLEERALCGEIMASYAQKRGLAGFVIYGAVRDAEALSGMDFPVYAKAVCPNGPYKNGPGEINVPVNLGGRIILPGDILVGDSDGLVSIHPADAENVLRKARSIMDKEEAMMRMIEEESRMDLDWMYKKLAQDQCSIQN